MTTTTFCLLPGCGDFKMKTRNPAPEESKKKSAEWDNLPQQLGVRRK
jgi:hypothetical protein